MIWMGRLTSWTWAHEQKMLNNAELNAEQDGFSLYLSAACEEDRKTAFRIEVHTTGLESPFLFWDSLNWLAWNSDICACVGIKGKCHNICLEGTRRSSEETRGTLSSSGLQPDPTQPVPINLAP